jgi:peptide/nickel transport system substrate-binding protein
MSGTSRSSAGVAFGCFGALAFGAGLAVAIAQLSAIEDRLIELTRAQLAETEALAKLSAELKERTTTAAPLAQHRPAAARALAAPLEPAPGATPTPGGTLRLTYAADPQTVDPVTCTAVAGYDIMRSVVEPLAKRRVQAPLEWEPLLAESWSQSEDGLTITVKLRRDARWHPVTLPDGQRLEGRPFTSDDVIFTLDVIMNPASNAAHRRPSREKLVSYEAISPHEVRYVWEEPNYQALDTCLAMRPAARHFYSVDESGSPLPGAADVRRSEAFAKAFNAHWSNKTTLVGTGPYVLAEYTRGARYRKERNREFRGSPALIARRDVVYAPSHKTAYDKLFARGEIDMLRLTPNEAAALSSDPASEARLAKGEVKLSQFSTTVYRFLAWNLRLPLFSDPSVRRALTTAIDRRFICEKLLRGLAKIHCGPTLSDGLTNDPTVRPLPYDPKAARDALDEAGWRLGADGVRHKRVEGRDYALRFSLYLAANSATAQRIAESIKENLRDVGVDMAVTPLTWSVLLEKIDSLDFECVFMGWQLDFMPSGRGSWHSSNADKRRSSNIIGFKDDEVDELIDRLERTVEFSKRQPLHHRLFRRIHELQPYTFLYSGQAVIAHDARVADMTFYDTMLTPGFDMMEWWIPEGSRRR